MNTISGSKLLGDTIKDKFNFIFIAVLLSLPAIILKDWILFTFPLIIAIILSRVYGERFIIALVLITLFTLIGDISRTLRTIVQLTDLSLIGYLFLKRYGLNFSIYKSVPKSVIYFLILYFSAMLLASIFSQFPFAGVNTIIRQLIFFIIVYLFYSLTRPNACAPFRTAGTNRRRGHPWRRHDCRCRGSPAGWRWPTGRKRRRSLARRFPDRQCSARRPYG